MSTSGSAPAMTLSWNPLPQRGHVKEYIASRIAAAMASVVCDAGSCCGKKLSGKKYVTPSSANKK
jgi:hypothetical protein